MDYDDIFFVFVTLSDKLKLVEINKNISPILKVEYPSGLSKCRAGFNRQHPYTQTNAISVE